jgi:hypothetical protein
MLTEHDLINDIHQQRLKGYDEGKIINHLSEKHNIRRSDISTVIFELHYKNDERRRSRAEWLKRKQ